MLQMLFFAGGCIVHIFVILADVRTTTACVASIDGSLLRVKHWLFVVQDAFNLWDLRFNTSDLLTNGYFEMPFKTLANLIDFTAGSISLGLSSCFGIKNFRPLRVLLLIQFLLFNCRQLMFSKRIRRQKVQAALAFFSFCSCLVGIGDLAFVLSGLFNFRSLILIELYRILSIL